MPINIKRLPPAIGEIPQKVAKTPTKAQQRREIAKRQAAADKKVAARLKGMDQALAQFSATPDSELSEYIKPETEKAGQHSYRLNEDQREARLVMIHRMLIRKIPTEEIVKQLGVSHTMYYKLRDQLKERMRLDVAKVDVPYLIGDSLSFYDEIRSMALTISSSGVVKDPRVKLSAMGVALKAEEDKNKFLTACGVYSEPVVEHIVRGMVSTGNFSTVDGQSQRVIDAEEINIELAMRLKEFASARRALPAPNADNCTPEG